MSMWRADATCGKVSKNSAVIPRPLQKNRLKGSVGEIAFDFSNREVAFKPEWDAAVVD